MWYCAFKPGWTILAYVDDRGVHGVRPPEALASRIAVVSVASNQDILIIGAGLAGAGAAEALAARGFTATVLEARDRVGGRGFSRPFASSDELLEFGGAWIRPWQVHIHDACARHGVALRPRAPVTERRWFRDGALHKDGPASPEDLAQHERCVARIAADALSLKKGEERNELGQPLTDISFTAYLTRIGAPQATRDLCGAWWTVSGNGDPARVPATEFLSSCARGGGAPDSMIDVSADTLVGGVTLLAERMIVGSGASLVRRAAVMRINPLAAIAFGPPLLPAQTAALATGHIGASVKIWAKVEGVPVGVLATGGGDGIEWMLSERLVKDGATLIVGFGLARNFDPERPGAVDAAVSRFFPEAKLVAFDWHDWVRDPFPRGTWIAPVLGAEQALAPATWRMTGPLAFASSDISPKDAGYLDAAIISGLRAAEELGQFFGRD
jgi:NAD(P)-dependent dehydrogenase (short-subunit alcohol dehydrogenase family)